MSPCEDDTSAHFQETDVAWGAFFKSRFDGMMDGPCVVRPKERAKTFEVEFNALKKYTIMARQRRNASMGACGLPVEILANIFAFAQVEWRPFVFRDGSGSGASLHYNLGWIYVTHVSRAWRLAAISTASLWQELPITGTPPKMATDILRRSRRLPLSVSAHMQKYYVQHQTRHLIRNWLCDPVLPLIQKLSIRTSLEEFAGWLPVFTRRMPAIRDLNVDLYVGNDPEEDMICMLSEDFLGDQPPHSLTRLSLRNVVLPASSSLLSKALTYLSLTTSLEEDNHQLTTALFRSYLSLMPNLEELRLINTLPYFEPNSHDPLSTTQNNFSPALKKLHVCVSMESVFFNSYSDFWRDFYAGSSTTVVSIIDIEGYPDKDRHALATLARIDLLDPLPVELWIAQVGMRLSFVDQPREIWTQRPVTTESGEVWDKDASEGRLVYTGNLLANAYSSSKVFDAVRAIYISPSAMELFNPDQNDDGDDDPAGLWITKFGANDAVRRIAIPYVTCEALLWALIQRDEDGAPQLFPALETIVLHDTCADETEMRTALDMALFEVLEVRREVGVPVKELLVGQAMADWSVWANVGEETVVTFFD